MMIYAHSWLALQDGCPSFDHTYSIQPPIYFYTLEHFDPKNILTPPKVCTPKNVNLQENFILMNFEPSKILPP